MWLRFRSTVHHKLCPYKTFSGYSCNLINALTAFKRMKNIYLLEDDHDITELVAYLAAETGLPMLTHSTIASLRLSLATALPDLFILDVMLPDGSGLDVCRSLKSDAVTSQIPILMMSAHANGASLSKAAGADDFIAKPFDINDFTEKLQYRVVS